MNQGGEPAHDDYGLPRVDIEIPDDARELDRDVQAYHRELRALRRSERSNRWRAPLRKSGMLVPLIAGCLVMAMIGGMVLTMFSANPNFAGITGQRNAPLHTRLPSAHPGGSAKVPGQSQHPASSDSASASAAAKVLPAGTIVTSASPISLTGLATAAIAIVPANCHCMGFLGRLIARARSDRVKMILVGQLGSSMSALRRQAPRWAANEAVLAIDAHNALEDRYRPIGLTVLLVDSHGHLRKTPAKLNTDRQIDRALRALKS